MLMVLSVLCSFLAVNHKFSKKWLYHNLAELKLNKFSATFMHDFARKILILNINVI
jgi:hypothetical protein